MFNRIRYIIGLAVALNFATQATQAQDTLTLEQCIALALENNLDAQQGQIRTQVEGVNLRQAKQNLLPDLTGRLNHTFEVGRAIDPETNQYLNNVTNRYGNQSLSSSMVLFDGLRMFRNITQQAYAYRATQFDEQNIKEQVALNVTSAYIQALTAKDMVAQADSQAAVTYRQVQRNTLLHEQGAIAPGDFYDLKGQYANDLNSLNQARNDFYEALVSLFQLINLPYNESVSLTALQELPLSDTGELTGEQLYQTAVERLSLIKAADSWQKQALFSLKAARSSYLPSLSVGAGLSSSYIHGNGAYIDQIRDRVGQNLGFTLAIPIFNKFQTRNNVALAKLSLLDAENVAKTRRNGLQQATNQALFNLDAAKERYKNLIEQVANYAESFRVAEIQFNAGAINSVEFLIAKNKMDNANANLVIARYQWHLRQRVVDYYNGQMQVE
ncbi:TolC family protein [Parapedobacter sp. DT-150]|uniref:TolC family protein n=1 Tax=Parapedobacter sp. DT-150 TaxID=3396162 RepID=UPI003F1A7B57